MPLSLKSAVFRNGEPIPRRYTADGQNVSPPLEWSGVPEGTREFALICEDPDAPTPRAFVHWILFGLSANTTRLNEGLPEKAELEFPVLARQGINTTMGPGYTGPNPPPWHGPHRYHFRLFALNQEIAVPPGSGRTEFLKALAPHVIEEAQLVGLYEKHSAPLVRKGLLISKGVALLGLAAVGIVQGTRLVRRARRAGSGRKAA